MNPIRPFALAILGGLLVTGCASTTEGPSLAAAPEASEAMDPGSEKDRIKRAAWADAIDGLTFENGRVVVHDPLGGPDRLRADAHVAEGLALMQRNHRTPAVKAFRQAVQTAPESPDVYVHLGRSLIGKGKIDLAMASFATAVDLDGSDLDARAAYAESLARLGRHAEAIESMRAALELDPAYSRAHRRLAVWYYYQNQDETAWEHVRAAEALGDPAPSQLVELLRRRSN